MKRMLSSQIQDELDTYLSGEVAGITFYQAGNSGAVGLPRAGVAVKEIAREEYLRGAFRVTVEILVTTHSKDTTQSAHETFVSDIESAMQDLDGVAGALENSITKVYDSRTTPGSWGHGEGLRISAHEFEVTVAANEVTGFQWRGHPNCVFWNGSNNRDGSHERTFYPASSSSPITSEFASTTGYWANDVREDRAHVYVPASRSWSGAKTTLGGFTGWLHNDLASFAAGRQTLVVKAAHVRTFIVFGAAFYYTVNPLTSRYYFGGNPRQKLSAFTQTI